MPLDKEDAITAARKDLARRLDLDETKIDAKAENAEFPDMALGAGTADEMSGQMITPGWRITLTAAGKRFEYRANKNQLRLFNYKGKNHRI